MTNDAYVAFLVGILVGIVLGIVISGILAAISNSIERDSRRIKESPKNIREIFRGRCPYTDEICESWNCKECIVEDRELMQTKEDY